MMKRVKRCSALALCLAFLLSLPAPAMAAETEAPGPAEGALGGLLADEIGAQLEAEAQDRAVTDLLLSGTEAAVTYHTDCDALLLAAVYEEESGQMTAAGSVPVTAGSGTEKVPLSGTMPAHFIVKAFLADPVTFTPLCGCFTLNAYTAAMQALEEATAGDYDASRVIDLDGDPANNFLVLKDSVTPLDDGLTVTWDADARVCTVSGSGAEDLALRPGDVISWGSWRDGACPLIVHVGSASYENGVLTILAGDDLAADDIFSVIKIDTEAQGAELQSLGETAIDADGAVSVTVKRELKKEGDNDVIAGSGSGTVSGTLVIRAGLHFYHTEGYTDFRLHFGTSFTGKLELEGKASVSLDLVPGNFLLYEPFPGVQFAFEPAVMLEFSATCSGSVTIPVDSYFGIRTGEGVYTDSDSAAPQLSGLQVRGTLFAGFNLRPSVGVLWIDGSVMRAGLADAALEGKVGLALETLPEITGYGCRHDCSQCFEFDASLVAELSAEVDSSLPILRLADTTVLNAQIPLGPVHATKRIETSDWEYGFGRCPYRAWRVEITALEEAFRTPASNVVLAVDTLTDGVRETRETCYTTDSIGTAVAYLPNGTHWLYGLCKGVYSEQKFVVNSEIVEAEILFDTGSEVTIFTKTEDGTLLKGSVIEDTGLAIDPVTDKNGEAHLILPEGKYTVYIENTADTVRQDFYWWGPAEIEVRGKRADINITMKPATFSYTYNGATLTVTGSGPMPNLSSRFWSAKDGDEDKAAAVVIEGFTSVSKWAFNNFHDMQSVFVSEGVRRIEDAAFIHATKLTDVSLPSTLRKLGDAAFNDAERGVFENTPKLTGIALPEGLRELGGRAFRKSGLTSIDLPDTITVMGDSFIYCEALSSVHLPEGLQKLPTDAFIGCTSLTNVTLPKNVTYCGAAFLYCTALEEVCFTSEKQPDFVSRELVAGGSAEGRVVTIKYPSSWEDPQKIIAAFEGGTPETVWIPYE
ncbi:MAG: leucine-rich repeat domain-containing protein [Ruminococcaceae bacterium]|nr:leucine-rich repeat domain-containing protein [Oscillospiraceae bacterium]